MFKLEILNKSWWMRFENTVAIDPEGSQYIEYANAFTHAHLGLASISLAKLSSKL